MAEYCARNDSHSALPGCRLLQRVPNWHDPDRKCLQTSVEEAEDEAVDDDVVLAV